MATSRGWHSLVKNSPVLQFAIYASPTDAHSPGKGSCDPSPGHFSIFPCSSRGFGAVMVSLLCSVSSQRWSLRGAAGTKRRTQHRSGFALPGDLDAAMPQGHWSHPLLWSPRMAVDTLWCISWRWGFACLKMPWAPLELAWPQSGARQCDDALCFQGDFAGKWWGNTKLNWGWLT